MAKNLIIKNIFKVHLFYYLAAFIATITGHFKGFILFSLIIIIHEFGHILMAIKYKWKIEKIILLPFGALTIFNEDLNRKMFEEFLIAIMGPIFQMIFTFLMYFFFKAKEIYFYSTFILCFNLLPIYPLDGSKLLSLFLNVVTSFKKSHLIMIFVSLLVLVCIFISFKFNLILFLILLFLIIKVIKEIKIHNSLFNRFLLERYLKRYKFNKYKKIKRIDQMKRDYTHIIFNKKRYVSEREFLCERFDLTHKL